MNFPEFNLSRRLVAEAVGTALLLSTIVGSGIMAESLAAGNVALALLANALATGAMLVTLLLTLGPISGAHLNPVVTLAAACRGELSWGDAAAYIAVQVLSAIVGVMLAHAMFARPVLMFSQHVRSGAAQDLSEAVATFGLVVVVFVCSRTRQQAVPLAVGAYIVAAYWFTASTSFANPAVTIARGLTDTFAGIRPSDIPMFLVAQVTGAAAATLLVGWLSHSSRPADRRSNAD